jgi:hypothetical protein
MLSCLLSRTCHVSYKKQELLTLRQYLDAPLIFGWVHLFWFGFVLQFTWGIYISPEVFIYDIVLLWFYSVSNPLIISDFNEYYLITLQMYVYFDVCIYCTRRISRTVIIMYAQSPQIGKPNNWKVLSSMKANEPKQENQISAMVTYAWSRITLVN